MLDSVQCFNYICYAQKFSRCFFSRLPVTGYHYTDKLITTFYKNVKVKLFLRFDWEPCHEGVFGSGGIAPFTRLRRLAEFTPQPLYPREKTLIPIGQEAVWAAEPFWRRWWWEKFPALAENRTPDHPTRSLALYHCTYMNVSNRSPDLTCF
jgi:hypothetical protein